MAEADGRFHCVSVMIPPGAVIWVLDVKVERLDDDIPSADSSPLRYCHQLAAASPLRAVALPSVVFSLLVV